MIFRTPPAVWSRRNFIAKLKMRWRFPDPELDTLGLHDHLPVDGAATAADAGTSFSFISTSSIFSPLEIVPVTVTVPARGRPAQDPSEEAPFVAGIESGSVEDAEAVAAVEVDELENKNPGYVTSSHRCQATLIGTMRMPYVMNWMR
jgi:hypothetical protein